MTTANDAQLTALGDAVERLHGAKAVFVRSEPVHEEFQGKTVWKGLVSLFDLIDHPSAARCFAWSSQVGEKQRFYAVLLADKVKTSTDAVRASIVADFKAGKTP